MAINNPYIPGDPYSYDLKWIVEELKTAIALYTPISQEVQDLYDFVHGYFESTRFEAQLDEALRVLASDGTLASILQPMFNEYKIDIDAEVNEMLRRINEQDDDIAVLVSRMDAFASLPPGSTAGNAELMDARVGYDGFTWGSAGDAVRGQVDFLHQDVDLVYGQHLVAPHIEGWIDGEYIATSDGSVQTNSSYHRTDYIEIDPTMGQIMFTNSGGSYAVIYNAWYDENKDFISSFSTQQNGVKILVPPSNAKYMRLSFNNTTTNTISYVLPLDVKQISDALNDSGLFYEFVWTNKIYFYGTGTRSYDNTRIGLLHIYEAKGDISVEAKTGYDIALFKFTTDTEGVSYERSSTGWTDKAFISAGEYFIINARKENNSTIRPSDYPVLFKYGVGNGFAVNTDLVKHNITCTRNGRITQYQSFCMYNGNYYSTNGSQISVQDSDFVNQSTTAISVGHGNGFQIGSANLAYISGWEDNTVYVVDLDTITLSDTITLPTTGYTTAAVDDVHGLMYILQRNTSPSTVGVYNFIVYDFVNDTIISNNVFCRQFAALQSMDFYEGKIIAVYGLGTVAAPSGMFVCDTNGTILSEIHLDWFDTLEPEGVFFNRETKELLISDINTALYRIEETK